MADYSLNEGPFGVYFTASSSNIDEEEVKKDFGVYGEIIFVKQNFSRVYVNFKRKTEAENCLRSALHSKYGEIRRGKFGTSAANSFQKENLSDHRGTDNSSKNPDRFEKKPRSSLTSSQFHNSGSHQMNGRNRDSNSFDNRSREDDDWFENNGARSPRNRDNLYENRDTDNFSKNADKFEKRPRNYLASSQFPNSSSAHKNGGNRDDNAYENHSREDDGWFENKNARFAKAGEIDKRKNDKSYQNSPRQETASFKNTNSQSVRNHLPDKDMPNEFMQNSRDYPPPLLSYDDSPPPLLSVNDCPPLLKSVSCSSSISPSMKVPTQKAHPHSKRSSTPLLPTPQVPTQNAHPQSKTALLPTPHYSTRLDYNPNSCSHQTSIPKSDPSPTSVSQSTPDIPPLVCASSHTSSNGFQSSRNSYSHSDYVSKYGNYVLIANLPEGTTSEEMEKVFYPHIPVSVSAPEVTNIKMKILFCLAAFNSRSEAAKAASKLDEVELRGRRLNMITLDELMSYSSVQL